MKKCLLITYFFPPVNAVAGLRAGSWANHFHEYGVFPTVITRHWSGNESKWSDLTGDTGSEITYEEFPDYNIYRLPSSKLKAIELFRNNLLKIPLFSKLFYFIINLLGHFNVEADARKSFREFVEEHLKSNSYDLIIVTSPPLNLIRLAAEINKISGIPVHVDFRDLWNNGYLNADYHPPFTLRYIDRFKKNYIQRWLKNVSSVSAVSAPIGDVLRSIYKGNLLIITNGYDETLYENAEKKISSRFRFALVGTYYMQQDFSILIDGLKEFLKDKKTDEVLINLIGVSIHNDVARLLKNALPANFVEMHDRVNTMDAVNYMVNSEVLFQAAWKGYRGVYTTKLFDFMASRNKVLIAPGDDDVIDEIVERTGTGSIANSASDFVHILNQWFEEWKSTGKIAMNINEEELQKYSRRRGAEALAKIILENY
ncbi:MAG: hypothetical protein ABI772_14520 [Bacteroidota bacterium]